MVTTITMNMTTIFFFFFFLSLIVFPTSGSTSGLLIQTSELDQNR